MAKKQTVQPTIKAAPLLNPLTENDRIALEGVIDTLPTIEDLLHRAEACGLDVSDRKAKHAMHKEIAGKLMEHFFPVNLKPPTGDE